MKTGIQTGGYLPPVDAPDAAAINLGMASLKAAGFDGIDFNLNTGLSWDAIMHGAPDTGLFDLPLPALCDKLSPFREAAKRHGLEFLQMHAPFPSYTPRGDGANAKVLQAIEKSIALCGTFGCEYLVIHPMYQEYDRTWDKATEWEMNRQFYTGMLPLLREYGVTACLENMFTMRHGRIYGACCSNMLEAATYIDRLNDIAGEERFGFCYDTGHALVLGLEAYTAVTQLGKRVKTLHIHDNDGYTDQHLLPHMGILDWDRFLQGLRAIDYQGTLCFEATSGHQRFGQACEKEALALAAAIGRKFAKALLSPCD